MRNKLQYETSPYLLQHQENPVAWYPWGTEAFEKAKTEDKPIFLSIGYSTCHWCHVMAHESFEDKEVAEILNQYFISIKVDKEERPDIDSIYMAVCQAFTGSGGWPTSIFMTSEQKPFFAGTYFPKESRLGMIGLKDLLMTIQKSWMSDREALLSSAEEVVGLLQQTEKEIRVTDTSEQSERLIHSAASWYQWNFDAINGGFGSAPKFPTPHNLLFLMKYYRMNREEPILYMVEHTLQQMYAGGIFDHIGYGFCRYSTDAQFLVPHFEKMLYDNALLILAYGKAYELTGKAIYRDVAEKTASYILREMTSEGGAFYSAQDADSEGKEGWYYLLEPKEVEQVLGKVRGKRWNKRFDITTHGNYEGKSIPNLLHADRTEKEEAESLERLRNYRKERAKLYTDDKVLTAWNSLMIAALCMLYRITHEKRYWEAAQKADAFLRRELSEEGSLYISVRGGKKGAKGILDDYAFYCFAQLSLYEVSLEPEYLKTAGEMLHKAVDDFFDWEKGGFWLCGKENETLIFQTKDTFDGAIPSGNSMMAYNLVRLNALQPSEKMEQIWKRQLAFMNREASTSPASHGMFLTALTDYFTGVRTITVVYETQEELDKFRTILCTISSDTVVRVLKAPVKEYPLLNDKITYYVCQNYNCLPPVNQLDLIHG